jgi:hypothetical protein
MVGEEGYALALLFPLGLTIGLGAYFNYVYIPQQKKAQRIDKLKKAGLSEEQALSFNNRL